MHYLVTLKLDYCDEFDVQGYSLWDETDCIRFQELAQKLKSHYGTEDVCVYFGTNEYFEQTIDDYLEGIKIKEIKGDFIEKLMVHIGQNFGTFTPNDLLETFEGMNDDCL